MDEHSYRPGNSNSGDDRNTDHAFFSPALMIAPYKWVMIWRLS